MNWWRRNSNTVLTVVEVVGFIGAIVTTARAAPKIKKKIDELPKTRYERTELAPGLYNHEVLPIPKRERAIMIVKEVGRDCVTPLIFSTVTIAAMLGTKKQYSKQQTLIASGYTMAKRLYDENREKVNRMMDDICPLDSENPSSLSGLEESMNGKPEDRNDIFFLEYSGRRFKSSRADVEEALDLLDEQFQKTGIVSFNDLYLYLGIAESKLGVENGFVDWFRMNNPEHQESEHLEWTIRGVTKATGINAEDSKKLEDSGQVIYMISFDNSLENVSFYRELIAYESDYSGSL